MYTIGNNPFQWAGNNGHVISHFYAWINLRVIHFLHKLGHQSVCKQPVFSTNWSAESWIRLTLGRTHATGRRPVTHWMILIIQLYTEKNLFKHQFFQIFDKAFVSILRPISISTTGVTLGSRINIAHNLPHNLAKPFPLIKNFAPAQAFLNQFEQQSVPKL